METPTPKGKRKRARIACEPCRDRKRKCDGKTPCTTCSDWGYSCYYEGPSTRKSRIVQPSPNPVIVSDPGSNNAESTGVVRNIQANSGAAFVRNMRLKFDPDNTPKLNLFGWNIGARQLPSCPAIPVFPIVDITSMEEINTLANVYFDKVDPCYGFIDRRVFFERLEARWTSSSSVYDSVLSGVAALGSLFSRRSVTITELHLVESARSTLHMYDLSKLPSIDCLTGWTLRVVYMRMTASPHATWLESSTLMHLIEASGLYDRQSDQDLIHRILGVAQHLNMWTSFDLGLSRVSNPAASLSLEPKPGDVTTELLNLLPISASLDPDRAQNNSDLESSLSTVLNGVHTQPPSVMAQCNLVLCITRRLYLSAAIISSKMIEQVLGLLRQGLASARIMVENISPWHHMANVPFHIVCLLLTIDTRTSLDILPEAMHTLQLVASAYDTPTMREAYNTACLLVWLHRQRRCDDVRRFDQVLNIHQQEVTTPSLSSGSNSAEISWLEGLVADMPSLQKLDLEQLFHTDMMESEDILEQLDF